MTAAAEYAPALPMRRSSRLSRAFYSALALPLGLALLVVGLAGCAGSNESTRATGPGAIAARFVPMSPHVDYHPDSLRVVSLSEDSSQIVLEEPPGEVLRTWSSSERYVNAPSRAHRPFHSIMASGTRGYMGMFEDSGEGTPGSFPFATLQSKEAYLAHLHGDHDIGGLSPESARRMVQKHLSAYEDTLRIDVYFRRRIQLGNLKGSRVFLRDDKGTQYPLIDASIRSSSTSLHGSRVEYDKVSLHFDRTLDGRDALATASRLDLQISQLTEATLYFAWRWDTPELVSTRSAPQ